MQAGEEEDAVKWFSESVINQASIRGERGEKTMAQTCEEKRRENFVCVRACEI